MAIFMVTQKQRFHAQEVRNVFYYDTSVGDPSSSEWQDIVDEIRADWVAELQGDLVNEWEFYGIDYRKVSTAGLLSFSKVPTAGAVVGTHATDSTPTQIALLVSLKGETTKPNRARSYLCGFHQDFVVDSLWLASIRGNAETFIDLQSVLNAGGTNPLTRVSAQWNTGHTQVIVHNDISGIVAVASTVPATQRRRRIGVGI